MKSVITAAHDATTRGISFAFATIIESTEKGTPRKAGAKMLVYSDGQTVGTIGGGRNEKAVTEACLAALCSGASRIETYDYFGEEGQSVCGGQIKVFIEPFAPARHLIICGAGHIALPLSKIARLLNFRVTVIDDRPQLANRERFPHVDDICVGPHAETLAHLTITPQTYIMIVTQGNEIDFDCLQTAMERDWAYLGVISSQAKRVKFQKRLESKGISTQRFASIKMPAGIDIGAQTPEEIALSIMAEITATHNRSWQHTSKFKTKVTQHNQ